MYIFGLANNPVQLGQDSLPYRPLQGTQAKPSQVMQFLEKKIASVRLEPMTFCFTITKPLATLSLATTIKRGLTPIMMSL